MNFPIFRKNRKTQKCLYLENCARQSNFGKIFDPQGICEVQPFQVSPIFHLPKMVAILNFSNFFQKCLYLGNGTRQSDFDKNFDPQGNSAEQLTQFTKFFVPPKMAAILNFRIFSQKIAKHKNASISKAVPDRANSANFLTHIVSVKTSLSKFQRIFTPQKWRPFLWVCKQTTLPNFPQKFTLPKNGGHC